MRIEDPEDVKRFHEYMKNPLVMSEAASKIFEQALKIAHPEKFDPPV